MSSFANLFGTSAKTDNAVDKLFSNSADGPISRDELVNKKRTIINIPETKRKKAKQQKQEDKEEKESEESEDVNGEDNDEEEEEEDDDDDDEVEEETTIVRKSKKNDDNEDLESQYFDKLLTENKQQEEERNDKEKEGDESEESETKEEKTEKTEKTEKPKKAKAATTIDLKEAELEKADRTIFVGNVPSEIITSKAIERSFKKLFKHYGQIESIRYRSISFDENLPRKVAFSKKNLHKSRDSANAYIVYKEKPASLAAVELNASVFEDHHLRVDHVAHPAPKDNKKTIFVGNLDFEEKEESLWKYFNSKLDNDVQFVRIVRDSKTNLGKGFALVQFKDTLSVNKALLLHDKPLEVESADGKKKGRKLRISRAKSTAKPSLMSPNHFDNQKKKYASNRSSAQQKLTDSQRTKLGRAQSVLGKADRSTVGKAKKNTIFEGQRATKGENIKGIKGLKGSKKGKVKKPRIRDRSTKFKEERKSMNKV